MSVAIVGVKTGFVEDKGVFSARLGSSTRAQSVKSPMQLSALNECIPHAKHIGIARENSGNESVLNRGLVPLPRNGVANPDG